MKVYVVFRNHWTYISENLQEGIDIRFAPQIVNEIFTKEEDAIQYVEIGLEEIKEKWYSDASRVVYNRLIGSVLYGAILQPTADGDDWVAVESLTILEKEVNE